MATHTIRLFSEGQVTVTDPSGNSVTLGPQATEVADDESAAWFVEQAGLKVGRDDVFVTSEHPVFLVREK
jgi:hypothetical protein